jgi:hypothetical protein
MNLQGREAVRSIMKQAAEWRPDHDQDERTTVSYLRQPLPVQVTFAQPDE